MTEPRTPVRDLAIGISVAAGALGLVFFGTVGLVDTATLALTVVILIWIGTTDPRRLVEGRVVGGQRPALMLFGLGGVGLSLLFTSAVLIGTITQYLSLLVGIVAFGVGLTRAIRLGWTLPPRER
jgi:hypothetical protein